MINLLSGQKLTRNYEEVSHYLEYLEVKVNEYGFHLNALSNDIYLRFKQLKDDFDNGLISYSTYREYLKLFRPYFKKVPPPYHPALKANEILKEFEKMKII